MVLSLITFNCQFRMNFSILKSAMNRMQQILGILVKVIIQTATRLRRKS